MPTFKLDGQEIAFQPGDTIIRAAHRAGIQVPHYCWHPGLSVAANCRMCLVEIESAPGFRPMSLDVLNWDAAKKEYVPGKKPKLQPACQQPVTEGMVVKSETSPNVALARKNVQEFLLVNHPVDCPICDQAGECMLQDYYMSQQRTSKRMRDEPVHKPKGVMFSDKIVYDAERCIACTRCVRFCEEVLGDPMLDMRERGNMYEITVSPGKKLEGHYQIMTEVVCPVGALTTSHWRHRGRVWLLKGTQSVCPGCATGCNMWLDVDPREQTVFRIRPRENEEVNKYWMCDDGMLTYGRIYKNRIVSARIGRGSTEQATVVDAVAKAVEELSKAGSRVAAVLSAQHSTEDNLCLADLAKVLGWDLFLSAKADWDGDKILRHEDQNPNRAGAQQVSGSASPLPSLGVLASSLGKYTAIVALGADANVNEEALAGLGGVGAFVLLATNKGPLLSRATVVLPVASWAEAEGSFVNAKGLSQSFKRALSPKGDSLPAWDVITRLAKGLKQDLGFKRFADVRAALVARTSVEPTEAKDDLSVHPESMTPRAGV